MMINRHLKALVLSCLCLGGTVLSAQSNRVVQDVATDYENGMELYRKGQYGNAQHLLDKVVEEEFYNERETRASAAYFAAMCAMRLYNGDAESRVDKFAERFELSPLANRLYLEYANNRFSVKRYRDAAEYYDKVDKFRLSNKAIDEYYFKKAYSHLVSDQPEKAKPLFFELKDKNSEYANSSRYYYAHLLYADSNYSAALTNFLPLQGDESFGPLVPYYLAHIYYKLGDYDKLLEVGEQLVENATPSRAPEIAKLMGDAFYNKKDYENAVKYLELYKEKGGRMSQQDHFELGYSLYRLKHYQDAIASFNKISGGNASLSQNAHYHLGDCYLKTDDKQKAITAFKAASEIDASPTIQEDAFFNYAKLVYEFSDPFEDAIGTLNNFLDKFPNSPYTKDIHRYLANLYITTKDYDRALQAIEKTGLDSPGMKEAYQKIAFYRGSELFNALKYSAALDKFKESLQYPINPTIRALSKYWSAETYYRLAEYDKSLAAFEEFRNSPGAYNMSEYNKSLYQTGYNYFKKFDFEKAAGNFRSFVNNAPKKDPRLADAYLRLADSYLLTEGYLVAGEFYNSALKAGTKEADYALYQRAICLGLAGKKADKVYQLQELLQKYPSSIYAEEAQYGIAETDLQLENYTRALAEFDKFIAERPNSRYVAKAKLQKGLVYSNTDRNSEALSTYKSIVKDYPGSEESLEAVGLARLVYARENNIGEYLDWVEGLNFVNFDKSTLDSTAFNSAFEQYSMGKCESAIPTLQNYLSRFPKGLQRLKANYYLADCARKLNKEDIATTAYKEILSFQKNEYSAEAVSYLAGKAYREKQYGEALKLYDQWLQLAESKESGTRAQAGIMRSAYALGDYNKSAVYAQLILNSETQDPALQRDARKVIVQSKMEQGQWEEAVGQLNQLIVSTGGETKAEAYYNLALVRFNQERYEESTKTIYKLIEEMSDYKEWKLRATILLANNFWKQEDIFQANYTLDFVIKAAYSQDITNEAQTLKGKIALEERRKAELKKAELMRKADSQSPTVGDGMRIIDQGEQQQDSTQINR